jgi:hypothetical protein
MTKTHARALALIPVVMLAGSAAASAQKPNSVATPKPFGGSVATTPSAVPQGFSVVLVLGEMQGNGATDNVPAAARKALADMKDFLPYKSYRFLDTQWTLCCGGSATTTRLRGPDEQDYDLELSQHAAPNGKWSVRFALREPKAAVERASDPGESSDAIVDQKRELERMEARLKSLRERYTDTHPDAARLRTEIAEVEGALGRNRTRIMQLAAEQRVNAGIAADRARGRALIDTSFSMDLGETVVVGTSRLKGDKALIALLTAVASTKPAPR